MSGRVNQLHLFLNPVKLNTAKGLRSFLNKKLKFVLVMLKSKCGYKKSRGLILLSL